MGFGVLIRRSYRVMGATQGDLRLPNYPVNTLWHTQPAHRWKKAPRVFVGDAPAKSRIA